MRTQTRIRLTDAERDRAATAFHEVGHAVAAVLAGARITEVVLNADGDGRCETVDLPDYADARVAVAGAWAATRWRTGAVPDRRDVRDELATQPADFSMVAAAPGTDPYAVGRDLETVWPAVRTLAADLYAFGRLRHRQVTEALGLPLWGVEYSPVAAGIRSGFWAPPARSDRR
ncbi:M50 family metallopeptidase [Nocardia cyriacigeorgica]